MPAYRAATGEYESPLTFITYDEPLGSGHAILLAVAFLAGEPCLHLVKDHLYVVRGQQLSVPAQLDGWLRDGSAEHVASLCAF